MCYWGSVSFGGAVGQVYGRLRTSQHLGSLELGGTNQEGRGGKENKTGQNQNNVTKFTR